MPSDSIIFPSLSRNFNHSSLSSFQTSLHSLCTYTPSAQPREKYTLPICSQSYAPFVLVILLLIPAPQTEHCPSRQHSASVVKVTSHCEVSLPAALIDFCTLLTTTYLKDWYYFCALFWNRLGKKGRKSSGEVTRRSTHMFTSLASIPDPTTPSLCANRLIATSQ